MVSVLFDLLSSEKSNTALLRVVKKFLRNWAYRVSKEAEFCADFKNVQKSRVWQKGNFAKNRFPEKKIFGECLNVCKFVLGIVQCSASMN